jgi:hypothetical protein
MRILCVLAILGLFVAPVSAAVLWDQSSFDPSVNALVDQEFGDFPDYSSYMVMDVTTDAGGWNVESVSTYFTNAGGTFEFGVNQGRLSIFAKTGALPTAADNPVSSAIVPVTVTNMGDHYLIEASGLSESLAGSTDYWIGLTPIADFGIFGQEFHNAAAPLIGADTAWRNPGAAFGFGGDWQTVAAVDTSGLWVGGYDAAFKVEGTVVPEPASLMLIALGGIAVLRRR